MCRRLGWHLDAGGGDDAELDEESAAQKVHTVYARAQYAQAGKVAERDTKQPFVPNWDSLAKSDPAQGLLASLQVRPTHACVCRVYVHMCHSQLNLHMQ